MSITASPIAAPLPAVAARVAPIPLRAWMTLGILMVFYLLSFADKQMFSLLADPIGIDMALSDVQVGVLQGLAFSLFYSSGVLLAGWCVDRYPVRWLLLGAVAFWSLAAAGSGLATGFNSMFLARAGVGFGEAFLPPAAYALIAASFPRDRFALANGIYHAGSNMGAVTTLLFGGLIIGWLTRQGIMALPFVGPVAPWQVAFFCTGLPGVILAGLALLLPRTTNAVASGKVAAEAAPFLPFIRRERLLLGCHVLGVALLAVVAYALITWSPAFLAREFGFTPERIGVTLAAGSAAGAFGNITWGWLSDKLFRRGHNDGVYRVFIGATLCGIPALVIAFTSGNSDAFIFLYAFGWFTASSFGPLIAAAQLFTPAPLRGRIVAVQTVAVGLLAIGLAPLIVAALAQYVLGGREHLGGAIAITVTMCGLAATLLLWIARGPLRRAVERENITARGMAVAG